MENFVTSRTVVGEAVKVGSTTILPLVDVSFGMAASAKAEPQKNNGGGGMGGSRCQTRYRQWQQTDMRQSHAPHYRMGGR